MRGDKQVHGIDYFDSYAPVVQWTTICHTLILAMLWNWETVQIDYTNAFAQVTLDEEIYMDMPHDFIPKYSNLNLILKLNKSIYGLKQVPLSWFEHLKTHLEQQGFVSSSADQCLFINQAKKIFVLVYIDDVVWVASDQTRINKVLDSLNKELEMTIEGDVKSFLGIEFNHLLAGEIMILQHGLID